MEEKKKFKILLVDDDTFISDMYALKFNNAGHELVVANNADTALDILRENDDFDALAVDLIMPGKDGLEFVKEAQGEGLAKDSVLMVLSNQADFPEMMKEFQELGAKKLLVKAKFLPNEVLQEVVCTIDTYKYDGTYGYCK